MEFLLASFEGPWYLGFLHDCQAVAGRDWTGGTTGRVALAIKGRNNEPVRYRALGLVGQVQTEYEKGRLKWVQGTLLRRIWALQKLAELGQTTEFKQENIALDGFVLTDTKMEQIPDAGGRDWQQLHEEYPLLRQEGDYCHSLFILGS